jgi:hypothetical protein
MDGHEVIRSRILYKYPPDRAIRTSHSYTSHIRSCHLGNIEAMTGPGKT